MNAPTTTELIQALAHHYGCPETVALSWFTMAAQHFNARVESENLAERSFTPGVKRYRLTDAKAVG